MTIECNHQSQISYINKCKPYIIRPLTEPQANTENILLIVTFTIHFIPYLYSYTQTYLVFTTKLNRKK